MRNEYRVAVRKHGGKRPLGRSMGRLEYDIEMCLQRTGCDGPGEGQVTDLANTKKDYLLQDKNHK